MFIPRHLRNFPQTLADTGRLEEACLPAVGIDDEDHGRTHVVYEYYPLFSAAAAQYLHCTANGIASSLSSEMSLPQVIQLP